MLQIGRSLDAQVTVAKEIKRLGWLSDLLVSADQVREMNREGMLAWHVREGHYGDVRLDGLNLLALAAFAAGLAEIGLRLSGRLAYRAGVIVAVGTSFLITWSNLAVGIIGKTTQGREIPYVIASRPLVRTPEEARRIGRPNQVASM